MIQKGAHQSYFDARVPRDGHSAQELARLAGKHWAAEDLHPSLAPCRRRLTKISDEGRRRLGVTACANFDGGTSSSFSVSLGRGASKGTGHTHSVAVSLKDGNAQDVFAVKISQDILDVYGIYGL